MPCMKCSNGKWKYGEQGNCQFDTLSACKAAAAAIHIHNPKEETMKPKKKPPLSTIVPMPGPHGPIPEAKDMMPMQPNPHHDATCQCAMCKGMMPTYK